MKKIITIILMLAAVTLHAQPLVFLGSSRSAVQKYMNAEPRWRPLKIEPLELVYKNYDENVSVSYRFIRDASGTIRTCVQCTVTLADSISADTYADDRVFSCRFRPDAVGWVLNTDLNDLRINVYRLGNSFIYKY